MPVFAYEDKEPSIDPTAFVAPTATVIGDVTIEAGASVWYGAVLRGDDGPIVLRRECNVQDNSVVHAAPGMASEIGEGATVGHLCLVHSARLERHALLGNGSTMLDGAVLGEGSMIAAGSLVTPGTVIEAGMLAQGSPCKPVKPIAGTNAEFWVQANPEHYPALARKHLAGLRAIEEG